MTPWDRVSDLPDPDFIAVDGPVGGEEPEIDRESGGGGPKVDDVTEANHYPALQRERYCVNTISRETGDMDRIVRTERLKQLLEERGIATAAEFARRAGLRESTARAYLLGTRSPPLQVCQRIGAALGVSGEWLYYGRGSKEPGPVSAALMVSPSEILFAAVEEAFLLAGYPPAISQSIAGELQLIVDAHPRVPPGMSPTDVIRRLVRIQLLDLLPPKGSE